MIRAFTGRNEMGVEVCLKLVECGSGKWARVVRVGKEGAAAFIEYDNIIDREQRAEASPLLMTGHYTNPDQRLRTRDKYRQKGSL